MEEETDSCMTLIVFKAVAPCTLTGELVWQGHEIYEALAISEVMALVEQHPFSQIASHLMLTWNVPE
ncbi:MAG: hypothetical protein ACJ71W_14610 [Terriglobales bacterium]|jgi:hypothetical protein